jgi:hypothetical protein
MKTIQFLRHVGSVFSLSKMSISSWPIVLNGRTKDSSSMRSYLSAPNVYFTGVDHSNKDAFIKLRYSKIDYNWYPIKPLMARSNRNM